MSTIDVSDVDIIDNQIMLQPFSGGKPLNIFNIVTAIDIYESLLNNTISADFYISEGIDLTNKFPVVGEEYVDLQLQTPSREVIKYRFFIESIEQAKSNDMATAKNYVLRGVSEDALKNSFKVYSKRYKNKDYDAAISEIITTDLGSSVSIETLESTEGKFDYVVNNVRPFQVIDLILERAISGEGNKSSTFFFYEDNKGYHFTTLEKLIKDRKSSADKYSYDTASRGEKYELLKNQYNILSYETTNQGRSIDKIKRGNMRMQIRQFDIKTGEYYLMEEYLNQSDYSVYEATDNKNDQNSTSYSGYTSERPGVTRMVVKDGTRPDMKHNENIHWKRPFIDKISQSAVNITVYGDTNKRVGDVVELDIQEITGAETDETQKYYSGKYVIFQLRHQLQKKTTTTFEHYMMFDLRKPNMKEAI